MASRIPSFLHFPLVAVASFALSSLLYSIVAEFTGPELAAVSRNLTDGWHIGGMVAWRLAELGIAWYAGYEYVDLAYLTLLNNVPYYFLLNTFYGIRAVAVLTPLLIDILTVTVPFALLRRSKSFVEPRIALTPNEVVVSDVSIRFLSALFGASIYAIVVYGSFSTWLPTHMVVHFDGLRSLDKAHNAAIYTLLALFFPIGFAVSQFLYVPAVTSTAEPEPLLAAGASTFQPETASLGQTVAWNLNLRESGPLRKTKVLAQRSAILALSSFVNTFVRVYVTIEGTEIVGAAGWASVWAAATVLVGVAYSWLGDE